jgi:hypothetical protein
MRAISMDADSTMRMVLMQPFLPKQRRAAKRPVGMNPDGLDCCVQVCVNGPVEHALGMPFNRNAIAPDALQRA